MGAGSVRWLPIVLAAGSALACGETRAPFLDPSDRFGQALAYLGDLDQDGIHEIAVGAPGDDKGAVNAGSVWILRLP